MPSSNTGKAGTITASEFTQLSSLVAQYGPLVIGQKISKICSKMSAGYLHEFPTSPVGLAWQGLGSKIGAAMGSVNRPVSSSNFSFLSKLVTNYGPEVVIRKVAKIAGSSGSNTNATTLKSLFPKATSASLTTPARRSA